MSSGMSNIFYSIHTDFGGNFNPYQFQLQIKNIQTLALKFGYINTVGDSITIVFSDNLTEDESNTLNNLKNNYIVKKDPTFLIKNTNAAFDTTTTLLFSQTENRIIQFPDKSTVLVGKDTPDILTNKILTSHSNFIRASELGTSGDSVIINRSSPPLKDQLLIADSATEARWKTLNINETVIFGSQFQHVYSNGESTTSSIILQNKLTLETGQIPSGLYRLGYSMDISNAGDYIFTEYEVKLNDIIISLSTIKTQDDYINCGGFIYQQLEDGNYTITIKYRTMGSGGVSKIKKANLEFWRIS